MRNVPVSLLWISLFYTNIWTPGHLVYEERQECYFGGINEVNNLWQVYGLFQGPGIKILLIIVHFLVASQVATWFKSFEKKMLSVVAGMAIYISEIVNMRPQVESRSSLDMNVHTVLPLV